MFIIVGLGNPGPKYIYTRHNIGFRVVNKIAANFQFPIFNFQSIFKAEVSEGKIREQRVILAKPQTFMNNSGKSVKKLIRNWKLQIRNLIVIHDDFDLPLGKIRIVKNRGAAGHRGVESIIKEFKTKDFIRFRLGIKPKQYHRLVCGTERFVLQKFNKDEKKAVKEVIKKTAKAIELTIKEGVEKAMSRYNK